MSGIQGIGSPRRRFGCRSIQLAIAFVCLALLPTSASAKTTYTWNGALNGSASWNSASNWSPNSNFPGSSSGTFDIATFDSTTNPTGLVTITAPTNLYLNQINFNQTTTAGNYLISGGTINLGGTAPTISVTTAGVAETISSTIAGSGAALTIAGAGFLSLTGTNTYSGGTVLSGGTLSLGSAGAIGTAGTILFAGGILQFTAANTTDYSSRFSNADNQAYNFDTNGKNVQVSSALNSSGGSLTKIGNGTLTLVNANNYSGGTVLGGGTLSLARAGALGTSGPILFAGGTLQFSALNTTDYSSRFSNVSNTQYNIDTNGQDVTFASGINSSGSVLTKTGNGTLTLSGTNSFSGGIVLKDGTLSLGSAGAIGTSGNIAFNTSSGGVLQFTAANTTDYSSRLSTAANQNCNIDTNGQTVTFANALNSSLGNLTKSGAGTLNVTASVNVTALVSVVGGTLALTGAAGALSPSVQNIEIDATFLCGDTVTPSNNNNIVRMSSGTIAYLGFNYYPGTLQLAYGSSGSAVRANLFGLASNYSDNAVAPTGTPAGTLTLTLAGSYNYRRSSSSTLNFVAGPNFSVNLTTTPTTSSGSTVSGGILVGALLNGDDWVRAAAGTIAAPSYVTDVWATGNNTTVATSSSPASGSTTNSLRFGNSDSPAIITLSGINTITSGGIVMASTSAGGTITGGTLQAPTSSNDLFVYQNSTTQTLTINSTIAGSFLTKSGPGTLILGGANSFSSFLYVNAGIIQFSADNNLGNPSSVNFVGGTLEDLGVQGISSAHLYGVNTSGTFQLDGVAGSGSNLQIGAGKLVGTGTLTKTGTSNLVLLGDNPNLYLAWFINDGFVEAQSNKALGNVTSTNTVTVNNGGQLVSHTAKISNDLYLMAGSALSVNSTSNGTAGNTYSGTITVSGNVSFIPADYLDNTGRTMAITGPIVDGATSGSITLTLTNNGFTATSGILILSAANAYSGGTTINKGTLRLGAANTIPSTGGVTLNGGTLQSGATTGFSDSMGPLTISSSSTISLGTGSHQLTFSGLSYMTGTLTVSGWHGTSKTSGTQGELIFSDLGSASSANATYNPFLSHVNFSGFGTTAIFITNGTNVELVPAPEPAHVLLIGVGVLLIGMAIRRRLSSTRPKIA